MPRVFIGHQFFLLSGVVSSVQFMIGYLFNANFFFLLLNLYFCALYVLYIHIIVHVSI